MSAENKKLVYEAIREKLREQIESIDAFNTRAGLILATCGVIFTGYIQLLLSRSWMFGCGSALTFFEIFFLLISMVLAFLALAPGAEEEPWLSNPSPRKLYDLFAKNPDGDIEKEATESMVKAYDHNRDTFKKKFDYLRYPRYALFASGSIFAVHLIIHFF